MLMFKTECYGYLRTLFTRHSLLEKGAFLGKIKRIVMRTDRFKGAGPL